MITRTAVCLCVFLATGAAHSSTGRLPAAKTVPAVRVEAPPVIDGRLDDAAWQLAPVIEDLHMVVPHEYEPPTERSEIRVVYGADALYFAARFYDSRPATAKLMRQGDMSWGEDGFSIILDPMNQGRSGYMFDINPNGVRSQALFTNVTEQNWNWQAIWHGEARQDAEGWTAEVRIPFKTLSFDPAVHDWGMNFTRWLGRRNARFGWVSHNREQNPAHSGLLVGLRGIHQGIGLDVVPGLRLGETRYFNGGAAETFVEPSVDIFYKVTPSLTGALTVNTDFSGTSADARQINLTRFDLFFPEQRKFFLQDADIFEFGRIGNESARPFFSRRIGLSEEGEPVDLNAGLKLTGREGRFSIGLLGIRQDGPQSDGKSDLLAMRLSANVLEESSLGMIATRGDPLNSRANHLLGVDFRYLNTRISPDRSVVGALWYQQSETTGLDDDSAAFGMSLGLPARRGWVANLALKEVQEDYYPALGFVNRNGIREASMGLGYTWRPDAGWFRSVGSNLDYWRVESLTGELQSQQVAVRLLELENHTADMLSFSYRQQRERLLTGFEISEGVVIPVGDYSFDRYCANASTGQHRDLSTRFSTCGGDFYGGTRLQSSADLSWRPNPHLHLRAGLEWNGIELPQGDFVTRLASLRADIAFTSYWYWENFLQYDNISETVGINSILRWVPEAGREMLLVVNRQLEDIDRDNRFHSQYGDMTFKLAYTLRF